MQSLKLFNQLEINEIELSADVDFFKANNDLKWKLYFKIKDPQKLILWNQKVTHEQNFSRVDHLWQRTCFELFFKAADTSEYFEINLNEVGEWNIYKFSSYRNPSTATSEERGCLIGLKFDSQELILKAEMQILDFFINHKVNELAVGFKSVIKKITGESSYWADYHVASEKPDFHNPDSYILKRKIYGI